MRIQTVIATTLLVFVAQSAEAVPLIFEWTDGTNTVSWELDSNPVPDAVFDNRFTMQDVLVSLNSSEVIVEDINFFLDSSFGGFNIVTDSTLLLDTFGAQLFGDTLDTPVFSVGTFDLIISGSGAIGEDGLLSTLTISEAAVVVPLPGAFGLFGLSLIGIGLVRGKKKLAV